jgi:hypothetical protein
MISPPPPTPLYKSIKNRLRKYISPGLIVGGLRYCAQVWGCLGKTLAAKVQILQNRAFRIITRENYTTRPADILNKLGVPNLEKRTMQQLSILI